MKDHDKKICFSHKSEEWETPQDLFDCYNNIYGFSLDVCATHDNAKCKRYFTKEDDGLAQSWKNETCWMNPPYGKNIKLWVKKAYDECMNNNAIVVALLPSRTDTKWFHEYIYSKNMIFHFIKGRLKFSNAQHNAPFPSMIVVFYKDIIINKTNDVEIKNFENWVGGIIDGACCKEDAHKKAAKDFVEESSDIKFEDFFEARNEILNSRPKISNLNCKNCGKTLISYAPYRMGYCEKCFIDLCNSN